LPNVAKRQAAGEINADHVRIIRKFFRKLRAAVDYQPRVMRTDTGRRRRPTHPDALRQAAKLLAGLVNPDGDFTDVDRARRRYVTKGRQQADGLTPFHGPTGSRAAATMMRCSPNLAAPGMCNPDDETPCVDGEPGRTPFAGTTRSQGQRNHDALKAMGRSVLASGELGTHNGLPATINVSTTLKELESGAGQAVTVAGPLLRCAI